MTTELEEQFFKVFGIEPIFRYFVQSELPVVGTDHCRPTYDLTKEQFKNFALSRAKGYKLVEIVKIYPEITDRRLLEMICILQRFRDITFNNLYFEKIEDLKNEVLSQIYKCKLKIHEFNAEQLKHQIQQLFKEEE